MHAIGGYQALFGKDGKPLGDMIPPEEDSPVPPLKIMVRGDSFPDDIPNQLFVEWIDGDGTFAGIADPNISDVHFLATGETVVPNTWYHVAFTLTATDAELWVARETGEYVLEDAISGGDFAGPSGEVAPFEPLGYAIGRSFYNNDPADWSNAIIDEVRLSDTALTPNEFLFVPAPAADADFDGDLDVDGNDFLIWQRNLGRAGTGTPTLGDANGDTNVDSADLAAWKSQFGGGAIQAVPEPAGAVLGMIALLSGAGLARRRHG